MTCSCGHGNETSGLIKGSESILLTFQGGHFSMELVYNCKYVRLPTVVVIGIIIIGLLFSL
jgi:hypothetical protein